MKHKIQPGILLTIIVVFTLNMSLQAGESSSKKGLLLVTFGTSYPEAKVAFDHIEDRVKEVWPDTEVRWAYTSQFIRKKLAKRGEVIPSPAEALARMGEEGFTHVVVQSLHMIPGSEFHDLAQTVNAFRGLPEGIRHLSLGMPLLNVHADLTHIGDAMARRFQDCTGQNSREAVVFMGHGSHHAANVYYPAFQYYLDELPGHFYIGTVEGYPEIDKVVARLKTNGIEKVCLTPFISVAGDHALNDMAGEDPESWKNILEQEGFHVEVVMKGLAEYDEVVDLWIAHLKDAENAWK